MASVKQQVIERIEQLPDNTNVEAIRELVEAIAFNEDVEVGLNELAQGKGVPHDKAKVEITRWHSE